MLNPYHTTDIFMTENTSIMQVIPKLVDFILWIIPALDKFPKSQKFLLGDRIATGLLGDRNKPPRTRSTNGKERQNQLCDHCG